MPTIALEMKLMAQVKQEGNYFLARIPALDVYSQGETEEAALTNLTEAMTLFFESCLERGTLESVLRDSGFQPSHDMPEPQADNHYIHVPLSLVANAENHAY